MGKLKVNTIEFTYIYQQKRFRVKGSIFKVHNYPQIYVSASRDPKQHDVFTFYKIDQPDKMITWFAHQGEKEWKALAIAKGLEKFFNKQAAS